MSPLYQLSPDANASPQVSGTLCNGGAKRQTEVSERFYFLAPFDSKNAYNTKHLQNTG